MTECCCHNVDDINKMERVQSTKAVDWTFYDNFFSYAVSLDGEKYRYDLPKKHLFQYGDDKSTIIQMQNTWYYDIEENENVVSMSMSFQNMPDELKEFTFHKEFQFDAENGLTGVTYILDVTDAEFDIFVSYL